MQRPVWLLAVIVLTCACVGLPAFGASQGFISADEYGQAGFGLDLDPPTPLPWSYGFNPLSGVPWPVLTYSLPAAAVRATGKNLLGRR